MTTPLPFVGPQFDANSLCAEIDPEVWFPEVGGSVLAAKKMCHRCENEDACLEWALANEEPFGIWGGKSPNERSKMLREGRRPGRPKGALKAIRHGTEAGMKAHQRRGDVVPATDPCGCRTAARIASAVREQRRRAA